MYCHTLSQSTGDAQKEGRVSPALFGRDAVKARTHSSDSVHSANPEESGAGVTHPDTAHEMRIPLRPLRMSKPYRRLRKRHVLRAESAKALLEMSVPTVSPSSET